MKFPIKDLDKETLVELAQFLQDNFVFEDNRYNILNFTYSVDKNCINGGTCLKTPFKTTKVWKFIDGRDFTFMSNRIGNWPSSLSFGSNGILYSHRAVCRQSVPTWRDDVDFYRRYCLSPLSQDIIDYFQQSILDKLNEWLSHFDLVPSTELIKVQEVIRQ